ncbi:hypothetical protein AD998_08490 [bacterium 336/3]|nr:hypothetical protein AD998_08490 [bacterium 336/3]
MIDINFQYYPIFSVELSHDYYSSGILPNTTFTPLPITETLLQKLGFLFRVQDNKFYVLYDQLDAQKIIYTLENNYKSIKLYFAINHSNPYFNIISNLPYTHTQKIYLSNSTKQPHLTKEKLVSEKDLIDFFEVRSLSRSISADKKVTLKKETGEIILEDIAKNIDFERITTGVYHITVEKGINQKALLLNQPQARLPLAFVEINLSEDFIKSMITSLKAEISLKAENYQIHFTTRKAYWKYYFISKQAKNTSDVYITKHINRALGDEKNEKIGKSKDTEDKDKHKIFKPSEEEIYKGVKAQVFISLEQMPIKEAYEEVFSLNYKVSGARDKSGVSLRRVLPTPSMDLIEVKNGKEYVPIIAYL